MFFLGNSPVNHFSLLTTNYHIGSYLHLTSIPILAIVIKIATPKLPSATETFIPDSMISVLSNSRIGNFFSWKPDPDSKCATVTKPKPSRFAMELKRKTGELESQVRNVRLEQSLGLGKVCFACLYRMPPYLLAFPYQKVPSISILRLLSNVPSLRKSSLAGDLSIAR